MPKSKRANHFEVRVAFFKPVWRRIVVTAAIAGWTTVEVLRGELFWAWLFGAATLWLIYSFFINWREPEEAANRSDAE